MEAQVEARRGPGKRGAPEVWPGVGGHDDAAEEDGDDPREAERLGGVEGGPREGKGERGLDDLGVAPLAQAQRLEEQRGGGAGEPADEGRAEEDRHEDERRLCGRRAALLGAGMVEGEHGAREDDGDGVVEDALAEDDGEDVLSHADGLEDGEDAHRVSRTHHGPEEERGEARERIAQAEQAGRVDHAAHRGAGEDCAHEGEQHCGHDARDEGGNVQVEPRCEDDRRQQPHHEELGAERVIAQHVVVVRELGKGSAAWSTGFWSGLGILVGDFGGVVELWYSIELTA